MDRQILFRGKRIDNDEWAYGIYCYAERGMVSHMKHHEDWIVNGFSANGGWLTPLTRRAVHHDSVGQYTGMTDKNGTKIFEGDILFDNHPSIQKAYSIIWFDGRFVRRTTDGHYLSIGVLNQSDFEIVGNVFDNPDLLKG